MNNSPTAKQSKRIFTPWTFSSLKGKKTPFHLSPSVHQSHDYGKERTFSSKIRVSP
jgi:hypothetical protein